VDIKELVKLKLGTIVKEVIFIKIITNNFISYFKSLILWVNRL
jgi:hypothetical protein